MHLGRFTTDSRKKTSLGAIQYWNELSGKTVYILAYFQGLAMADLILL